jgi:hypothetical protein
MNYMIIYSHVYIYEDEDEDEDDDDDDDMATWRHGDMVTYDDDIMLDNYDDR